VTVLLPSAPAIGQARDVANPGSAPVADAPAVSLPAGAATDWWSAVQEEISQSEYHIAWQEQTALPGAAAAYQAPNRAQGLRSYFTAAGPVIVSRTDAEAWRLELRLAAWGWSGAEAAPGEASLAADGNRIEYRYPGLVAWYVNTEQGLEQGFTLPAPAGEAGARGELVLDLALATGLAPRLTADGAAVEFALAGDGAAGGAAVLRYGDLHAIDAAGRTLPVRLELLGPSAIGHQPSAIRVAVDATGAVYPITLDPTITGLLTPDDWIAESDQDDASFGWSVGTAGDVNGDGYDDVVVGAYSYDNGQVSEGRAYVYHGSASGLSATAAWTAESDQANAHFGWSVGTAGDVNGDGCADVIVGAYNYDNGQADEGRAYVYHGSAGGLGAAAAWIAEGDQLGASFGIAVGTAGDVNGDGYADVVVGAIAFDNNQANGRVYVYLGSALGLDAAAAWTAESDQADTEFGYAVGTAGDVNGDGYADVVVGAPSYDNGQAGEGRAFVWHGSSAGLGPNGTPTNADWSAESDQAGALFGLSLGAAGDVNGDGYADVVVGAPYYDNDETDEGRAFVYHGSAGGLGATAAWTKETNEAGAWFGWSVGTAGDVNGDGYADVILGAPDQDIGGWTSAGLIYLYFGSATGLTIKSLFDPTSPWPGIGDQIGAFLGWSVGTAGDVNGDGYADVVVGAPGYDNGQTDEGRAYVFYGSADRVGLSLYAAWTARGEQEAAEFGCAVGTAGDVNGDGYDDVIVGAYYYDNGEGHGGRAFVYHGSAGGLNTTAAWTAQSDRGFVRFGLSVGTAGDVNGDGYADVIVGAPEYLGGRAYVYLGSAAGLSADAAWTVGRDQPDEAILFGWSVGTAGDVNGDGYADVIVGAPQEKNGQTHEGLAYVYHGSATGLSATAAWTAEGDQASAYFGQSVGTAGDVNGDGYADVIVGMPGYAFWPIWQADQGRAFVYHGSATGLRATAAWMDEGDQRYDRFGYAVGTAGDVNGDGYADVIVGEPGSDDGQEDEGRAYVYNGSEAGLSTTPARTMSGGQATAGFGTAVGTAGDVNGDGYADVIVGAPGVDSVVWTDKGLAEVYLGSATGPYYAGWADSFGQDYAQFGAAVGTAGDVNGDGYADVIVGAPGYGSFQPSEGRAFLYHGNWIAGLAVKPQQRRADNSAPVAPGGQSFSSTQVRLAALARTPFGRSDVALQWEIKPMGVAFDGTGLGQGAWADSGTAGASFNRLVSGLSFETRYHWRVRILGRPAGAAANSAITYRSRWIRPAGSTFFTALSGEQQIEQLGQTSLLGQAAYVDVASLGLPPLSSLTLRGYADTQPPNASSFPGYETSTSILDRYFSLEPNSGAAGYQLRLCLNYDDGEVTVAGATESDLQLCRWTGLAWTCKPRAAGSDTGENLVCADRVDAFSNWAIASGAPLAVTLADFTAEGQAGQVLVSWETVSELDNAGFNLYRSDSAVEPQALLGYTPSQAPGSTQGAAYSYVDADVEAGQTYWYWLEAVDLAGATTLHGPVSATVLTPTAVTVAGFEAAAGSTKPVAGLVLAAGLAAAAGGLIWRRRQEAVR
jgi:hypothetical protein